MMTLNTMMVTVMMTLNTLMVTVMNFFSRNAQERDLWHQVVNLDTLISHNAIIILEPRYLDRNY